MAMTAPASSATIEQLTLADEPARWEALGFAVSDATVRLGAVHVALAGRDAGRGIIGWSLRETASVELDGLPTVAAETRVPRMEDPPPTEAGEGQQQVKPSVLSSVPRPEAVLRPEAPEHPNGVTAIDHVVAMSPDLDRSVRALQAAGLDLRRIREQPTPAGAPRQAFFRLGEVILELVQEPAEVVAARADGAGGPARFWGLALLSNDLYKTVGQLGEHSSEIRAAVQPGRQIATLRRSAGLAVPVALMSPTESRE
jgi:hypothetical protein